jgi:hypothetical protein
MTGDDVRTADEGLDVVADGRAVATMGASMAGGLAHPGVISLPLSDGPAITTRLVWRSDAENPLVHTLIDLARALTTMQDEARSRVPHHRWRGSPAPTGAPASVLPRALTSAASISSSPLPT